MSGLKIHVYSADLGACGRYRLLHAAAILKGQGHDITIHHPDKGMNISVKVDFETDDVIDVIAPEADVLVMQRVASKPHVQAIKILRERGYTVVLDLDDDMTRIPVKNKAYQALDPRNGTRMSWLNTSAAAEAATLVTVSTKALVDVYGHHGRVMILDNWIPERYLELSHQDRPLYGWAGSIESHPDDLTVVGNAARLLAQEGHHFFQVGPHQLEVTKQLELQVHRATGPVSMPLWASSVGLLGISWVPLVDTLFNAAKCLDASERISSRRGLVPVGDLCPGDEVWRDGWRRVHAVQREPQRMGLEVQLEGGYRLRLTPEHRMLVNGAWIPASEFKVGDLMAMAPEVASDAGYISRPWPADSRMSRKNGFDAEAYLTAEDSPRVTISPRWGRILGVYVGDGSVGQSTRIDISCDGQDQDWIDTIMSDLEQVGFLPYTESKTTWGGEVIRKRRITISSAHLLRVLAGWGLTTPRPNGRPLRNVCVPDVVWESPLDVIAQFLSAFFESDGHCTSTGVAAVNKGEQFMRDIQRLLLLFGIKSNLRAKVHAAQNGFSATYWHVIINRAGADVFAEKINFQSKRKRDKLATITSKPHSNALKPMTWNVPIVSIVPCLVDPVDIQVEGEEFVAAGMVSHNSRLKGLESNAVGVPYIASPRAEYVRMTAEGAGGLLASKPREWYKKTLQLLTDHNMRRELGQQGREWAATQTIEKHAWKVLEAWHYAYDIQHGKLRNVSTVDLAPRREGKVIRPAKEVTV